MKQITVVKEFLFDSAHYLPDYDGDCCHLHGHTYKLEVGVTGPVKPNTGMVVDFKQLKTIVKLITDKLDHSLLNDLDMVLPKVEGDKIDASTLSEEKCIETSPPNPPPFPKDMPTAENMVVWLTEALPHLLRIYYKPCYEITLVRLWETPTSYAEWRK